MDLLLPRGFSVREFGKVCTRETSRNRPFAKMNPRDLFIYLFSDMLENFEFCLRIVSWVLCQCQRIVKVWMG